MRVSKDLGKKGKVSKKTVFAKENEEEESTTPCWSSCPWCYFQFLYWFSRRPVFMGDKDKKRCKLDCKLVQWLCVLTVSNEVAKATLETLRRKREDHLRMVREIKEIQYAGTEKMAKFAK